MGKDRNPRITKGGGSQENEAVEESSLSRYPKEAGRRYAGGRLMARGGPKAAVKEEPRSHWKRQCSWTGYQQQNKPEGERFIGGPRDSGLYKRGKIATELGSGN